MISFYTEKVSNSILIGTLMIKPFLRSSSNRSFWHGINTNFTKIYTQIEPVKPETQK